MLAHNFGGLMRFFPEFLVKSWKNLIHPPKSCASIRPSNKAQLHTTSCRRWCARIGSHGTRITRLFWLLACSSQAPFPPVALAAGGHPPGNFATCYGVVFSVGGNFVSCSSPGSNGEGCAAVVATQAVMERRENRAPRLLPVSVRGR